MKLIKDGVLFRTPTNNTIEDCNLLANAQNNVVRSFLHSTSTPSIIVASYMEAAINMAKGNISIGKLEDDRIYMECKFSNGNICAIILDEDENSITYEFNEDFENSNNVWPLAAVMLYLVYNEVGSKELKEAFEAINRKVKAHQTTFGEEAFIFCDYLTCRLTHPKKTSLEFDTKDSVSKVRDITNGGTLAIVKDLTTSFTGMDGVFEKIITTSNLPNTIARGQMLGLNKFLLNETLTDVEQAMVPFLTGVVERKEYVRTIECCYNTKDYDHPYNTIISMGPSGCGKSFFSKVLAAELGLPYYHIIGSEEFSEVTLKGMTHIVDGNTVFERSALAKAMERPCVIEFAEVSAIPATVLTSIYDLADKEKGCLLLDDGSFIRRHPHCYFVFTFNVYKCMHSVANSLQARGHRTLRLPMMSRENLAKVILRDCEGKKIDKDILENVLDCIEQIETYLRTAAPKGCDSSMRSYAYWTAGIQDSRDCGCYNPIDEARCSILPTISCGANYNEDIEEEIINTIISPTFDFIEDNDASLM